MLSHVIPQCLVTDRITIKLQLTGKSRLIFKLKRKNVTKQQMCPTQSLAASCERDIVQSNITLVLTASNAFNNHLR